MKTLLVIGLIGLALMVMIFTVVGVHFHETRKIRERLGTAGAHPNDLPLMQHITDEQELTRQHISNQLATKDNDGLTTKGVVIDIRDRIEALIKTINDFVRSMHK